MIKTFADRRTRELYENGKSKRFPPGIWERAVRKLEYLDLATSVTELSVLPSNRLHKLERDRAGQYQRPNGERAFDLKMAMRTTLR